MSFEKTSTLTTRIQVAPMTSIGAPTHMAPRSDRTSDIASRTGNGLSRALARIGSRVILKAGGNVSRLPSGMGGNASRAIDAAPFTLRRLVIRSTDGVQGVWRRGRA